MISKFQLLLKSFLLMKMRSVKLNQMVNNEITIWKIKKKCKNAMRQFANVFIGHTGKSVVHKNRFYANQM